MRLKNKNALITGAGGFIKKLNKRQLENINILSKVIKESKIK